MKTKRMLFTLLLTLVLVTQIAIPVYAAGESTQLLPPLPQWPIIGPVLQWIGVVPETETPEVVETPDPELPEFQVTDWEDLKSLETDIPRGEAVRVVATDTDLNAILKNIIDDDTVQSGSIDFNKDSVSGEVELKRDLLEDYDVELPDFISGDSLRASGTAEISVESCRPVITIEKLRINGRNMGLGKIAQGAINEILEENWTSDICLKRVILTDGEIAVEGIRY